MMTRSLRYVEIEVRDMPMYDRLSEVDDFLNKFEKEVPKQQCFNTLKWVLRATPTIWWGTHQRSFEDWRECRRTMRMQFEKPQMWLIDKYDRRDDPRTHLAKWTKVYGEEPQPEWVHLLCHTLDIIPINWYTETKLHHSTGEWDILHEGCLLTFTFEDRWWDTIDDAPQVVKAAICRTTQDPMEVLQLVGSPECYSVNIEEEDEDPQKINIPKTEGYREV